MENKQPSRHFEFNSENLKENALQFCDHLRIDYGLRADRAKKKYKRYRYANIFLITSVTILSFINLWQQDQGYLPYLKVVIPIIATMATFTATLLSVTNAQKDWISSRTAGHRLSSEKFLFLQKAEKYSGLREKERVALFSESITKIWEEIHKSWEDVRLNGKG